MIALGPLFADIDDVIGVIIGIIFVIFAVVGQLVSKMKQSREEAARRQRRAQAGPRPGGGPQQGQFGGQPGQQGRLPQANVGGGGGARGGGHPLEDEIGEFLRRAAQRRGQPQPPTPRPQQPARPAQAGPRPPRPGRPPVPPVPRRVEEPLDIEIIEDAEPVGHLRGELSREKLGHLQTHIGRGTVPPVERKIGDHLHETFDHQVGHLGGPPGDAARPTDIQEAGSPDDAVSPWPSTAAAGLAAMLSSGEGVRQAILIHEILDRPEHRWT